MANGKKNVMPLSNASLSNASNGNTTPRSGIKAQRPKEFKDFPLKGKGNDISDAEMQQRIDIEALKEEVQKSFDHITHHQKHNPWNSLIGLSAHMCRLKSGGGINLVIKSVNVLLLCERPYCLETTSGFASAGNRDAGED